MRDVDQLLRNLRCGPKSCAEIQRDLGISQPTMSRLVREAGPRLVRIGRSVATRYAARREIPGLGHRVPVYRVDEQGTPHDHGSLHLIREDGSLLERSAGDVEAFGGLPPFVEDMRPQGYIGRHFPIAHPELRLSGRITDWDDDHQLMALAMRGEDCVGQLIIGDESLNRFLARAESPWTRADYPALATGVLAGKPGPSAGGEHPKFAVASQGRHLLVKFAGGEGPAAERWRDLLVAEHAALEVVRGAGFAAAHSGWFDLEGIRYLELERFDRVGRRGRRGVISLAAINNHFLGYTRENWSIASRRILDEPTLDLSAEDADRMVWLDTFGDLIGNTDRHYGNISFYSEDARTPRLAPAPVYDMLPMVFAPVATTVLDVSERPFQPHPPTALNRGIWRDAAALALSYWRRLGGEPGLSDGFRRIAGDCHATLARLIDGYS